MRFFDPYVADGVERAVGASWLRREESLEALLEGSDCLSLHCTLDDTTRHLLDGNALALLPQGAFVVNTARGGLIDDAALAAALQAGSVGGAGLDCVEGEPALSSEGCIARLVLPQLHVTPHSAFCAPHHASPALFFNTAHIATS